MLPIGSVEMEIPMKSDVARNVYTHVPPQGHFIEEPLPPPPPSRLVGPMTIGVIVEGLTVATIMVVLASGQFSIFGFVLGVLGVLMPLLLAIRSFWLMSRDEARAHQKMMLEQEGIRPAAPLLEEHEPLTPLREVVVSASRKEPVHV